MIERISITIERSLASGAATEPVVVSQVVGPPAAAGTTAPAAAPAAMPVTPAAPRPVVEASGLVVTRGGQEILHGLDLRLAAGSVTGLLGPSGCGKTTLMRAIVGVQHYSGRLEVLSATPGSTSLRGRIGYLTQEASIYRDLSARQNVAYFASLAGPRARGVDEVLREVGIADIADRLVSTFSGGQRNRVSLACALVAAPELLVLDEPTVGLDPVTREDLWEAFRRIAAGGTTILVSSHVMDEAFRCDGVLLMREGCILADTTAPELLASTGAETLDDAFLTIIRQAGLTDSAAPTATVSAAAASTASKETSR
ncbi:ABC transporter ATP-binding protein [Actinomyces slackii]|uniref:Daunorubicin/doxorubicin resistance ATP-binding protein DrrA n=1 Tax=Actinomyces slackii TaxID=52774 RepID=A0A448KDK9_9ACTO|nr:ABC transporter ATP-binding protein [Actinomyces slackii]VEG75001.1 Daunorubicin/doxorubicin resistance ATP-binding protein DrrA [Actinomyces slackii]